MARGSTGALLLRWDKGDNDAYYENVTHSANGRSQTVRFSAELNPPVRTLVEIWSPVAAGALVTVLVVAVWSGHRWLGRRLSAGWLVVGLALVGLNVAGSIAVSRSFMRYKQVSRTWGGPDLFGVRSTNDRDGIRANFGSLDSGEPLLRLIKAPPRPGRPRDASPLGAGTSITLLVLFIPISNAFVRCLNPSARGRERQQAPAPRPWRMARSLAIAVGLVGVNIAGYAASPVWDWGEPPLSPRVWCDPYQFPDEEGRYIVPGGSGLPIVKSADGRASKPAIVEDFPLPLHRGDGTSRVLDTVIYRPDGSIVVYKGNPGFWGRVLVGPRVLQPATRSFLEVWWPAIGSMFISLVVIAILWRQARARFPNRTSDGAARVDRGESP
jgi:hypothetical protein